MFRGRYEITCHLYLFRYGSLCRPVQLNGHVILLQRLRGLSLLFSFDFHDDTDKLCWDYAVKYPADIYGF
jgi:hypothetical protein